LCFVPLVFGGTVYRMIEKIMTFKLVYVLSYLTLVTVLLVPASVWWEVTTGFFRFGTVPLRAESIVAGRHFDLAEREGEVLYRARGTVETDGVTVAEFAVMREGKKQSYKLGESVPEDLTARRQALIDRAKVLAQPGRFFIRSQEADATLTAEGTIDRDQHWHGEGFRVTDASGSREFGDLN